MNDPTCVFDLGLTLAESDVPARYVEYFAQMGRPGFPTGAQRAYHLANKYFMRELEALW